MKRPPPSRRRLEGDLVTQSLETSDKAPFDRRAVALIEIAPAQVVIGLRIAQEMAGADQDQVADRRGTLLGPTSSSQASVLGSEMWSFRACGGFASGVLGRPTE